MKSDTQPQKRGPTPLKMEMVTTRAEATPRVTPVKSCARGAATEINPAPAVTFSARISQSTYHRGVRNASPTVYSRVERTVCCCAVGEQPAGAQPSGALLKK